MNMPDAIIQSLFQLSVSQVHCCGYKIVVKLSTVMKETMNYQFYLMCVSFVTPNNSTCLEQGQSSTKNGHLTPTKALSWRCIFNWKPSHTAEELSVKQDSVSNLTAVPILICKFKFAVSYLVLKNGYTCKTDLELLVPWMVNTCIFCLFFNIDGSDSNSQFSGFNESSQLYFSSNISTASLAAKNWWCYV